MNLRRRSPRRSRPGMDWLETRNLLSGSASGLPDLPGPASLPPSNLADPADGFGITDVSPSLSVAGGDTGTGLAGSPPEISITLSQPIDPSILPTWASPVALYRVVDGQTSDAIFDGTPPVSVTVEDGDTRIVIVLDPSQPLTPGTYRLVIPAGMPILSTDYTPLPGSDNDIVLGDFSIAQPEAGIGRSGATDLGTILPDPVQVPGNLDLSARPHDVALYRIQIPNNIEMSAWRLGLEARAADGSTLHAGLTLFDSQGRPIATSTIGRPSSPDNPYLFAGVEPGGTYYVGVSSYANMPGQPGGYEIESERGTPGTNAEAQTGGGFVIGLVADPIDAPTKVLTFTLDQADPSDTTPSGFTIDFNGAVEPGAGIDPVTGEPTSSLKLVDSQGRTYDLTLSSFDETHARLSFLFPSRLLAGSYSVVVLGSGGLADLIGRSPQADGLPEGILARFDVVESPPPNGLDLGVIYPGDNSRAGTPTIAIEPGATADFRFVAATPGAFRIATPATGTGLSVGLVSPDGTSRVLDPSVLSGGGGITLVLTSPGVYHLRITSAEVGVIGVGVLITGQKTDADSLIRSGIGQGPALELRLISPQAPPGGSKTTVVDPPAIVTPPNPAAPTPSSPPLGDPAGPDPAPFAAGEPARAERLPAGSPMGESLTASSNSIPVVDLGGQLVGRPDSRADRVATVSSAIQAGSNGLAANQGLLPLGLILDPSRGRPAPPPEWAQPDDPDGFKNGAMVDRRGIRKAAEPAEETAAEAAAPGTDWVDRALAAIGKLIAPERAAEVPSEVDERLIASIDRPAASEGEAGGPKARHQIGLAEPVGLTLLIAALTQQGRRALRRREAEQGRKSSRPTPPSRPHGGRLTAGRRPILPLYPTRHP
ncbi:MAG: hypothetical protein U0800_17915 [Isosphaeraceae bacterium]